MGEIAVVLKVADVIFKVISSPLFKEILSIKDYEKDTERLAETIKFIGDVLSDFQGMRFQETRSDIEAYNRLRKTYLDGEDFLDEVETWKKKREADERDQAEKEMMIRTTTNGKGILSKSSASAHIKIKSIENKTRRLFCCWNAGQVHNAIKGIRKDLDAISRDIDRFRPRGRSNNMESIGTMTTETGSFVNAARIIGREEDKIKIFDMLSRAPIGKGHIPVVLIVGIGGVGKTTVAQLVYNDAERLESFGFDLKLWVFDSQKFDLKSLLQKILKSNSPDDTTLDNLKLDALQSRLRREIHGKKFFLILDNVKNESFRHWEQLEDLLKVGAEGSRILITTRSRAVITSDSMYYELKCLSEKDSWSLFKKMAFQGSTDVNLVQTGKGILQKCGRNPMAIKTIGSLLRGRQQTRWEQVRDSDLARIEDDSNDILPILRASYEDLDSKSQECFRYCAIFPKNRPISKEILINIWMSNVCDKINTEDAYEDVVSTLYNRCFLDKIEKREKDNDDDICFRMHDLMIDLAREVAGAEMFVVDSDVMVDSGTLKIVENVRHLNLKSTIQIVEQISTFESKGRKLRTLLHHDIFTWRNPWEKLLSVDKLMSDFPVLRMLDLQKFRFDSLPGSVGRLIHLRYLNLSYNEFLHTLPDSIADLWNLQSLLLKSCKNLKELSVGIRKLINLRHLNLEGCNALTCMPSGMGALKQLRTLNMFIVGDMEHSAKLEDLELLSNVKGDLIIKLPEKSTVKDKGGSGAFLLSKRLRTLKIEWADSDLSHDTDILAKLQPHSDLVNFTLYGYECLRFPHWADDLASSLPNLVSVIIDTCKGCQHLPSFSKLQCLKRLTVCHLWSLEYMEDNVPGSVFFPSLEYFWLMGLRNLKGWCRELANPFDYESVEEQSSELPSFPHLTEIFIYDCPHLKMTSMPVSPVRLYSLKGDELDIFNVWTGEPSSRPWSNFPLEGINAVASSLSYASCSGKFHTDDMRLYLSNPWEQCLHGNPMSLKIMDFNAFNIPSGSAAEAMVEAFRQMSKFLTSLEIISIPGLKAIPKVLQHLTALGELRIVSCNDFTGEEYQEDNQSLETREPWKGFESLIHLSLDDLPSLVRLPKEIQVATSLQVLEIYHCKRLKGLESLQHPSLSEFQWLKCLSLSNIPWLEYIQESDSAALSFPSLEVILLKDLPNLRDWCRELAPRVSFSQQEQSLQLQPFPCLSRIAISRCPNLNGESMLLSSVTEFVYGYPFKTYSSSKIMSCKMYTDEVLLLKTALWEQYLRGNPLSVVMMGDDIETKMMKLDLERISSHLTSLKLDQCPCLGTVPKGLKHLTVLQKLSIERCEDFIGEEHEEDSQSENESWWGGFKSLTHLEFTNLPKMKGLPRWIMFITSLQEVRIVGCNNLLVPEWVHPHFHHTAFPEQQIFRLVKKRVEVATPRLQNAEMVVSQ